VTKNVTITIGSKVITKSVTFGAADNTPASVASRIATDFTNDGSLTDYSFTVAAGELVVAQASNFAPAAINVTIQ